MSLPPKLLGAAVYVLEPNEASVTDLIYIRTHDGWLYLAVALDLFSRQIVKWSIQKIFPNGTSYGHKELVVSVLLTTLWKRKTKQPVLIHKDQDSRFSSYEWQDFLKERNLKKFELTRLLS